MPETELGHIAIGQRGADPRSTRSPTRRSAAWSSTSTASASTRRATCRPPTSAPTRCSRAGSGSPRRRAGCAPGWPPRSRCRVTEARDRRRERVARVRRHVRAAQRVAAGHRGHGLRAARAQRLGQVDADPHPVRPARADRGPGQRARARRGEGRRGDPAPDRLHEPAVLAVRGPHRAREPRVLRRGLRPVRRPQARPDRRRDRADPHRALHRPARRRAVGRLEAAARARRRADARAARGVPRRADRGHRPGGAPRAVGPAVPARGRRHHAAGHHPLHGRGRALRRGRLPVPVAAAGHRHAGRAQGAARGQPPGRPPGRDRDPPGRPRAGLAARRAVVRVGDDLRRVGARDDRPRRDQRRSSRRPWRAPGSPGPSCATSRRRWRTCS